MLEQVRGNGGDGGDGGKRGDNGPLSPRGDYDPQISYNLHDETIDHSWGDFKTWFIIIGLSVALVVSTLVIYAIIGKHTLQHWNLGYPPTTPDIILPMP